MDTYLTTLFQEVGVLISVVQEQLLFIVDSTTRQLEAWGRSIRAGLPHKSSALI